MTKTGASTTDANGPGNYEIRVQSQLDQRWSDKLEGLTFIHEGDGITKLRGPLADQAALHGVLNRIRDLGIPIISVQRVDATEKKTGEASS